MFEKYVPGGSSVTGVIKKKKMLPWESCLAPIGCITHGPNGHQCLQSLYVYGSREKNLLEKGQVRIFL